MMLRKTTALCILGTTLAVGSLTACGNLSEEDLVFQAAIPPKQALELRPAGADEKGPDSGSSSTQSQALEAKCDDGDLRCGSRNAAHGLNQLTFGLLDIIDRVLQQPPT